MNNIEKEFLETQFNITLTLQELRNEIKRLEYQIKSFKKNTDERVARIINNWYTEAEKDQMKELPPKTNENIKYHKAVDYNFDEIEDEIRDWEFEEKIGNGDE